LHVPNIQTFWYDDKHWPEQVLRVKLLVVIIIIVPTTKDKEFVRQYYTITKKR